MSLYATMKTSCSVTESRNYHGMVIDRASLQVTGIKGAMLNMAEI